MLEKSLYTLLFTEAGHFYLYNSRANFFSEISKELYHILLEERFDSLPADVINTLKDKEIILPSGNQFDYYFSTLLKFNHNNFQKKYLNLVIAPTTSCNFSCPYCFEEKKQCSTMTDDVIDTLINFVSSHDEAKGIFITWYGGEPLIAFNCMRKIFNRLSKKRMPEIIGQSIITNGYCFTPRVIKFFEKKGCESIQITIDGIGEKHDKTRCLKNSNKPTFGVIINNIKNILATLVNTRLSIRVNINKENYMDFVEVFNYFNKEYPDCPNLHIYPGLIREESSDRRSLCSTSFTTSEILELNKLLRDAGVSVTDFPRKRERGCMMHNQSSYLIGPKGEIYKCWNDIGNPNAVIGNISDKALLNASRLIKYSMQAIPFNDECKHCLAFPICDGGCGYHRYKNMFEGCNFDLCSPYKNVEKLKNALLSGELPK